MNTTGTDHQPQPADGKRIRRRKKRQAAGKYSRYFRAVGVVALLGIFVTLWVLNRRGSAPVSGSSDETSVSLPE
jgi:hypothetical protein